MAANDMTNGRLFAVIHVDPVLMTGATFPRLPGINFSGFNNSNFSGFNNSNITFPEIFKHKAQ